MEEIGLYLAEKFLKALPDVAGMKITEKRVREETSEVEKFYKGFIGRKCPPNKLSVHPGENKAKDLRVVCPKEDEGVYGLEADTRHEIFKKSTIVYLPELVIAPKPYEEAITDVFAERYAKDYLQDEELLESWYEMHEEHRSRDKRVDEIYRRAKTNLKDFDLGKLFKKIGCEDFKVGDLKDEGRIKKFIDDVIYEDELFAERKTEKKATIT